MDKHTTYDDVASCTGIRASNDPSGTMLGLAAV